MYYNITPVKLLWEVFFNGGLLLTELIGIQVKDFCFGTHVGSLLDVLAGGATPRKSLPRACGVFLTSCNCNNVCFHSIFVVNKTKSYLIINKKGSRKGPEFLFHNDQTSLTCLRGATPTKSLPEACGVFLTVMYYSTLVLVSSIPTSPTSSHCDTFPTNPRSNTVGSQIPKTPNTMELACFFLETL